MLTVGDKKGKQAGAVRAAGGLPASIELVADPDAVGAKPLTHARLVVSGMAALAPVTVQVALRPRWGWSWSRGLAATAQSVRCMYKRWTCAGPFLLFTLIFFEGG